MTIDAQPLTRSAVLHERSLLRAPGGVHSNVRLSGPTEFIESAHGAWMFGVDGTSYLDYLLGQGPSFLGHAPPQVMEAVQSACRRGMVYGGQHALEVEAAELVCDALGWPDMVRFGVSGTESVQAAFRLARAVTGRTKIVRFEGHYHGWLDNVLMAKRDGHWGTASDGQLGSHLADFLVLPWNDPDALTTALDEHGSEIAAIVMEPIMMNAGAIEPRPGYLETVRRLATQHGAVLIFDEVIAGFRLALGGAAEYYGVIPDLATYGKAMAGGWPVSALAGRHELMAEFGTGRVNHSGTFNSSVMAMAATAATVTQLREDPPYEPVAAHGNALMDGIVRLGHEYDAPLHVQGVPMAFHVTFGSGEAVDHQSLQQFDLARYERFATTLVAHGLWVTGRGVWYVSAAHGPDELDVALNRFEQALVADA